MTRRNLVLAVRLGQRYDSFDRLLQDLCRNDAAKIGQLIDTRGCTTGPCRKSNGCACAKCALYQAAGLNTTEEVMAMQIKVLFPINAMDSLYALSDELVSHVVTKPASVFPVADDVIKGLSQFLKYRFPPCERN